MRELATVYEEKMKANMAEGSEYFPIGSVVACRTCHDRLLEGEVQAFDPQTKILILKCPASNNKSNLCDIYMVNLAWVSEVNVKKESTSSPPNLQQLNLQRLTSRAKANLDEKMKLVNAMAAGVSPEGQKLFMAINKTIDEIAWEGEDIVVLGQVIIMPPYKPESCKCAKDDDQQALIHIRKIVEKHNHEQQAAQQSYIAQGSGTMSGTQSPPQ